MPVYLSENKKKVIPISTRISQDTLFYAIYSGDCNQIDSLEIEYGISVSMTVQANDYYLPGLVEIPYQIVNTGIYPVTNRAEFILRTLSGAMISELNIDYSLVPEEFKKGILNYNLVPVIMY